MIPTQIQVKASTGNLLWKAVWDESDTLDPSEIVKKNTHHLYRATLRGSPWTSFAWKKDNPGFVFWYEPHHAGGPRFTYGMELTRKLSNDICTRIHMVRIIVTKLPIHFFKCVISLFSYDVQITGITSICNRKKRVGTGSYHVPFRLCFGMGTWTVLFSRRACLFEWYWWIPRKKQFL